jgi:hypothetical protein
MIKKKKEKEQLPREELSQHTESSDQTQLNALTQGAAATISLSTATPEWARITPINKELWGRLLLFVYLCQGQLEEALALATEIFQEFAKSQMAMEPVESLSILAVQLAVDFLEKHQERWRKYPPFFEEIEKLDMREDIAKWLAIPENAVKFTLQYARSKLSLREISVFFLVHVRKVKMVDVEKQLGWNSASLKSYKAKIDRELEALRQHWQDKEKKNE